MMLAALVSAYTFLASLTCMEWAYDRGYDAAYDKWKPFADGLQEELAKWKPLGCPITGRFI